MRLRILPAFLVVLILSAACAQGQYAYTNRFNLQGTLTQGQITDAQSGAILPNKVFIQARVNQANNGGYYYGKFLYADANWRVLNSATVRYPAITSTSAKMYFMVSYVSPADVAAITVSRVTNSLGQVSYTLSLVLTDYSLAITYLKLYGTLDGGAVVSYHPVVPVVPPTVAKPVKKGK